jgi:hypothetical protein
MIKLVAILCIATTIVRAAGNYITNATLQPSPTHDLRANEKSNWYLCVHKYIDWFQFNGHAFHRKCIINAEGAIVEHLPRGQGSNLRYSDGRVVHKPSCAHLRYDAPQAQPNDLTISTRTFFFLCFALLGDAILCLMDLTWYRMECNGRARNHNDI